MSINQTSRVKNKGISVRIFFLHLSDFHFKENDNEWCTQKVESLKSTLSLEVDKDDYIFIVATGDLTSSGSVKEFETLTRFFKTIKNELGKIVKKVEIVSVPGNHDCDLSTNSDIRDLIVKNIIDKNEDIKESYVEICTIPQENYFKYLIENEQDIEKRSVSWCRFFDIEDLRLTFNCINTAWISTKDESEKGYGKMIMPINEESILCDGQLNITLLHHPYNWFRQGYLQTLRKKIEDRSDIIFTGHEHSFNNNSSYSNDNHENINIASAASKDNRNNFNFSFVSVNLTTNEYQSKTYKNTEIVAEKKSGFARYSKNLKYKYPFKPHVFTDLSCLDTEIIHHNKDRLTLADIFVWPRVKSLYQDSEIQIEYIDFKKNIDRLSTRGVKFIYGEKYAGKTSLGKMITLRMNEVGKYVVMFDASTLLPKHSSKEHSASLAKDNAAVMYRDHALGMVDMSDRVAIVDSVGSDKVNNSNFNNFIISLKEIFNVVIILADDSYRILESLKSSYIECEEFEIENFKTKEKIELIEKWLTVGGKNSFDDDHEFQVKHYLNILRQAVENNLIPSLPFYMILLLNNAMAMGKESGTVSSSIDLIDKMIRLNLINMTLPEIGQNGVPNFLSEFSYLVYKKEGNPILLSEFDSFVQSYAKDYRFNINTSQIKDFFIKKNILKKDFDRIFFNHDYLYYYFLGRYLAEQQSRPDIQSILDDMIKKAYREDYSNIIVFISFFTSDLTIYYKVIHEAKTILAEIDGTKLSDDISRITSKLTQEIEKLSIDENHDHKDALVKYSDQKDGKTKISNSKKASNEKTDAKETNVATIAYKYIQILGQMVKNRTGNLKGNLKEECIAEVVSLSSRLLGVIFKSAEDNLDMIVESLSRQMQERALDKEKEREKNKENKGKDHLEKEKVTEVVIEKSAFDKQIKSTLFIILQRITLNVVEKVSFCAGTETLKLVFDDLNKKVGNNYSRICSLAVSLDYYKEFELGKFETAKDDFKKNYFTSSLLRLLVYRYLLTNKTEYKLRQQLCEEFSIDIKRVNVLVEKNKE